MPNRIIKESACTSETLASISAQAERLFWRLVVTVDDHGCFDGRPAMIRGKCFTAMIDAVTNDDVEVWLSELARAGLIQRYTVRGKPYLHLTTWAEHQRTPRSRPKFPLPPGDGDQENPADNCGQLRACDGEPQAGECAPTAIDDRDREIVKREIVSRESSSSAPADADPPKPAKALSYGPEHMALAVRLRDRIVANKPDARVPRDLSAWANTARLMVERDGRSPERIAAMIDWCQSDEFWRANVLSMDKLRDQFDRLELQAARRNAQARASPDRRWQPGTSEDFERTREVIERVRRARAQREAAAGSLGAAEPP